MLFVIFLFCGAYLCVVLTCIVLDAACGVYILVDTKTNDSS